MSEIVKQEAIGSTSNNHAMLLIETAEKQDFASESFNVENNEQMDIEAGTWGKDIIKYFLKAPTLCGIRSRLASLPLKERNVISFFWVLSHH